MAQNTSLPQSLQQSLDSTDVDYVRLGSSGLRISVPVLGTFTFGSKVFEPWILEEEESLKILKYAYDHGINTWDTSNNYSNGISEIIIGRAIKRFAIPRKELVLMTKCFFLSTEDTAVRHGKFPYEIARAKTYVNQYGLSRVAIMSQVEASLQRLGTDYIDLLQIHRFDPDVPIEETMLALHDLVRSGKVRYIGASSMWATQFARMQFVAESRGWTKFVSMQCQYSLLYREEEREMLRFCRETGVGILSWGPLRFGLLTRPSDQLGSTIRGQGVDKKLDDADRPIIGTVQQVATEKKCEMVHVALAWVAQRVSSPIVGCGSIDQLARTLHFRRAALTEEDDRRLEEHYKPKPVQDLS